MNHDYCVLVSTLAGLLVGGFFGFRLGYRAGVRDAGRFMLGRRE